MKFLMRVTGHLGWNFSEYMMVLCQKLHITDNFFDDWPPLETPASPNASSQSVGVRTAPAELPWNFGRYNTLNQFKKIFLQCLNPKAYDKSSLFIRRNVEQKQAHCIEARSVDQFYSGNSIYVEFPISASFH